MPYHSKIEPRLLDVFRLLIVVLTVSYAIPMVILPEQARGSLVNIFIFNTVRFLVLFAYISSPLVEKYLKGYYLPLAIVIATVDAPVRDVYWRTVYLSLISGTFGAVGTGNAIGTIYSTATVIAPPPLLLVILVAWQYDLRRVIQYVSFSAAVEFVFALSVEADTRFPLGIILTVLVIRSGIMLLIGYTISRLVMEQRRQRQELIDANVKVARYAAMVETLATSRERNRLARELHDTLAHSLTAAIIQLEATDLLWNNQQKARELLQGSVNLLRAGLTDTRRALEALRASPLEDLGLLLALRELGKNTQERTGKPVTVELPEKLDSMSVASEQVVYRVAQEALENVVRHARARRVSLKLHTAAQNLQLEIRDDGVGFDAQKINQGEHFGIRGMLEGAQMAGGRLLVDSKPGAGTLVRLEMKLVQ